MKVILITLSGDTEKASYAINELFPGAEIERVSRDLLENGSMLERLKQVRVKSPDILPL